jgi:hypothetical protein
VGQAGGRAGRLDQSRAFDRYLAEVAVHSASARASLLHRGPTAERHLHACIAAAGLLLRVATQHGMESRAQVLELGIAEGWDGV